MMESDSDEEHGNKNKKRRNKYRQRDGNAYNEMKGVPVSKRIC